MSVVAVLALVSAVFYCVAMVAMKTWWVTPNIGMGVVIATALLAAGAFEVAALRQERLGLIYIVILAAEVVIISLASVLHFEESYTGREIAGVSLVLVGTFLAWS